ncbi:MAG: CpaF family protein [Deltaproteobacteria bacterium]|nr:CpaF family protein [Deltaproteobacteria bacterium]
MIPIEVYRQTLLMFLEPIMPYLEDPRVSEILINGPSQIFIEREGKLFRTDSGFATPDKLITALHNIAQYVGRPFSQEDPILEGSLPDGSRVEAILPPVAPLGPMVAIRRFSRDSLTVDKLIQLGSMSREAARLLSELIACKKNIIVAGGTGSGKTSLLNVISSMIAPDERVVVIEDARELRLQRDHIVQLEARPPDSRGRGRITIRDLFKATLRMRPDRIVIGEIRGAEALDLVQAMTSGHGGCLSTIHASYPIDALSRLETLALMSEVQLPLFALRLQIASAIDVIVQTSRLADGSRAITHITEALGCDPERGYQLKDLFIRTNSGKNANGEVKTELVPTGAIPSCIEATRRIGLELPPRVYETSSTARKRLRENGEEPCSA